MSRRHNYTKIASADRAPFVLWPKGDDAVWVEAIVEQQWEGKHGQVLRLRVEDATGLTAVTGTGDQRVELEVRPGDIVNLGLNLAGLESLNGQPVGTAIRVDYLGWGETTDGTDFRKFEVGVEKPTASGGPGLEGDVPVDFPTESG